MGSGLVGDNDALDCRYTCRYVLSVSYLLFRFIIPTLTILISLSDVVSVVCIPIIAIAVVNIVRTIIFWIVEYLAVFAAFTFHRSQLDKVD